MFSTHTTNRGSAQSRQREATVMSSASPFICIAPSPASATSGRSGRASFAAMPYGSAEPIEASVLDRWAGTPAGRRRCRAYQ